MGNRTEVVLPLGWKDDSVLDKEKLAVAQPLPSSTAREVSVKPWDKGGRGGVSQVLEAGVTRSNVDPE